MDDFYNGQNSSQQSGQNYDSYSYGAYSYTPVTPKAKKGHSTGIVILSVVLAAIIGASAGVTGILSYLKIGSGANGDTLGNTTTKNISISVDENAASIAEAVSEKAGDSVVGIRTTTSVISFFGGNQEATGSGSGVVYSKDGYIITNYHVVEEAVKSASGSKIEVFIGSANSKSYDASVVGYNISSDLAVIKILLHLVAAVAGAEIDREPRVARPRDERLQRYSSSPSGFFVPFQPGCHAFPFKLVIVETKKTTLC